MQALQDAQRVLVETKRARDEAVEEAREAQRLARAARLLSFSNYFFP